MTFLILCQKIQPIATIEYDSATYWVGQGWETHIFRRFSRGGFFGAKGGGVWETGRSRAMRRPDNRLGEFPPRSNEKVAKGRIACARRLLSRGAFACRRRGSDARDTLILTFSHKGFARVGLRLNSDPPKPRLRATRAILAFPYRGRFASRERGLDPHPSLLPSREKGFVASDSCLAARGGLGFNPLDSRFRGNDGERNREWRGEKSGMAGREIGNDGRDNRERGEGRFANPDFARGYG